MVIYLDSSALIKLYVEEVHRQFVVDRTRSAQRLATSTATYAEARAGLARRLREGDFTDHEHRAAVADLGVDWVSFIRIQVSNRVAYHAGALAERHSL